MERKKEGRKEREGVIKQERIRKNKKPKWVKGIKGGNRKGGIKKVWMEGMKNGRKNGCRMERKKKGRQGEHESIPSYLSLPVLPWLV